MKVLFTEEDIDREIVECWNWLLDQMNLHNKDKLLIVPILDGSLPFFSMIISGLTSNSIPFDYATLAIKGYKDNKQQDVYKIDGLNAISLKDFGDHLVVIVDDILDTGKTLRVAFSYLQEMGFRGEDIVAVFVGRKLFLGSEENSVVFDNKIEIYSLFKFPREGWIVGFGMDDNGRCRGLPDIGVKEE